MPGIIVFRGSGRIRLRQKLQAPLTESVWHREKKTWQSYIWKAVISAYHKTIRYIFKRSFIFLFPGNPLCIRAMFCYSREHSVNFPLQPIPGCLTAGHITKKRGFTMNLSQIPSGSCSPRYIPSKICCTISGTELAMFTRRVCQPKKAGLYPPWSWVTNPFWTWISKSCIKRVVSVICLLSADFMCQYLAWLCWNF